MIHKAKIYIANKNKIYKIDKISFTITEYKKYTISTLQITDPHNFNTFNRHIIDDRYSISESDFREDFISLVGYRDNLLNDIL